MNQSMSDFVLTETVLDIWERLGWEMLAKWSL
jgi:hypothetical protein